MTLPIALDLRGKLCLVVGEGEEALQRVEMLNALGAVVRWVHSRVGPDLEAAEELLTAFEPAHLDGAWLAILAEANAVLGAQMQRECEQRQIWFCAIDQPEWNSFSHMATVRVDPIVIGISSAGRAPALARRLREQLEELLRQPPVAAFFRQVAELRTRTDPVLRREALKSALAGFRIEGRVLVPHSNSGAPPNGSGAG
ncbi:MAG TPA: bifunctional precorrin-2 dehydrogenase/sirohydrochlorin ferrochelatase [Polyangiaceae bacterium]|jgi:uroporphyrin-III C-methyltransferase/precorrin-2 dehydrogenase/sirohydrochlorin ferrochelatase|nr:bifunctional precorrin-2 dehydrogenase/sirohydrochlorin ferrochelatase [Polyangiaceae bacterium]